MINKKLQTGTKKKLFQPERSLNVNFHFDTNFLPPHAKVIFFFFIFLREVSRDRFEGKREEEIDDGQRLLQNVVYCFKVD